MKKTEIEKIVRTMAEIGPKLTEIFKFRIPDDIANLDLIPIHFMGMNLLKQRGPLIMSELAESLGISHPMTTHLIDKLESVGMVERRRDDSDRRAVKISLTRTGRDAVERITRAHGEQMVEFINCLDDPDRKSYVEAMNTLFDIMLKIGKQKSEEEHR